MTGGGLIRVWQNGYPCAGYWEVAVECGVDNRITSGLGSAFYILISQIIRSELAYSVPQH